MGEPYRQAGFWDAYSTSEVAWTQAEKLAELDRESITCGRAMESEADG